MTSDSIIRKPHKIWIQQHSLVTFCGIANSGKTTLAKRLFPGEKIIDTNLILENTIDQLIDITEHDLGITTASRVWQNIAVNMRNVAKLKSEVFVEQLVIEKSKTDNIVILDSVSHKLQNRLITISDLFKYFENIYLIVVFPDLKEVLSHTIKDVTDNQKAMGFYRPNSSNEAVTENFNLKTQICNGMITLGTTETIIITDLNSDIEVSVL
ncbi:MAG: hypothetical protein HFJ45_04055 [Clostridia bacterium]|nr:hypothetical protein [Clostridia bacterium]